MRDDREVRVSPSAFASVSTQASVVLAIAAVNGDDRQGSSHQNTQWSNAGQQAQRRVRWLECGSVVFISGLLMFLAILSMGSGWTFPGLMPDRLDGVPWRMSFSDRHGLMRAAITSVLLSVSTAFVSTTAGFLLARRIRHRTEAWIMYVLYMPFVVSPLVAGVCLYDLMIRLQLAGSAAGVLLVQCSFATSFSTIYFRAAISQRLDRTENLIMTLGGNSLAIWQHAIWPQCRGLIVVCLIQTALYSWLDYGLVSVIGGGNLVPLTVRLFGYVREASINQAALASLLLMLPAIAGLLLTIASVLIQGRSTASDVCLSARQGDAR